MPEPTPQPPQAPAQSRRPPGSQTETETVAAPPAGQTASQTQAAPAILRLRGAHAANPRSVRWAEDVVNNEGLGRKSSKVCCIYHRPRAVDESSDDGSSSSSDSSSDSDSDAGGARNGDADHAGKDGRRHGHGDHDCGRHRHGRRGRKGDDPRGRARKPSPNAYEKMPPRPGPSGGGRGGGSGQKPPNGA